MKGIWITHPQYAAYAAKLGIVPGVGDVESIESNSLDNAQAFSKATWADNFRAEE